MIPAFLKKPHYWVPALLVGVAFGFFLRRVTMGRAAQFAVTFPGGFSVDVAAQQERVSHDTLLDHLYDEPFSQAGLMEWLRQRSIFHIADRVIADSLPQLCSDLGSDASLKTRLAWQRECANVALVRDLREMVQRRQVPFHFVGQEVRIGVPSTEDQPALGQANACAQGLLHGRTIELTNVTNRRQITVSATGQYRCTGLIGTPDLQLSHIDAQNLFDGPIDKYQDAVAIVVD